MTEVKESFDTEGFKREIAADIATYVENIHGDISPEAIEKNVRGKGAIETKITDAIADNPTLHDEILQTVKTAVWTSPSVMRIIPCLCPPVGASMDKTARESLYYTLLTNILKRLAVKSQCKTKDIFDGDSFRRLFEAQAVGLTEGSLLADVFSAETREILTNMAVILKDALRNFPDSREQILEVVKDVLNRAWGYKVLGRNSNAYNFILETAIGLLAI